MDERLLEQLAKMTVAGASVADLIKAIETFYNTQGSASTQGSIGTETAAQLYKDYRADIEKVIRTFKSSSPASTSYTPGSSPQAPKAGVQAAPTPQSPPSSGPLPIPMTPRGNVPTIAPENALPDDITLLGSFEDTEVAYQTVADYLGFDIRALLLPDGKPRFAESDFLPDAKGALAKLAGFPHISPVAIVPISNLLLEGAKFADLIRTAQQMRAAIGNVTGSQSIWLDGMPATRKSDNELSPLGRQLRLALTQNRHSTLQGQALSDDWEKISESLLPTIRLKLAHLPHITEEDISKELKDLKDYAKMAYFRDQDASVIPLLSSLGEWALQPGRAAVLAARAISNVSLKDLDNYAKEGAWRSIVIDAGGDPEGSTPLDKAMIAKAKEQHAQFQHDFLFFRKLAEAVIVDNGRLTVSGGLATLHNAQGNQIDIGIAVPYISSPAQFIAKGLPPAGATVDTLKELLKAENFKQPFPVQFTDAELQDMLNEATAFKMEPASFFHHRIEGRRLELELAANQDSFVQFVGRALSQQGLKSTPEQLRQVAQFAGVAGISAMSRLTALFGKDAAATAIQKAGSYQHLLEQARATGATVDLSAFVGQLNKVDTGEFSPAALVQLYHQQRAADLSAAVSAGEQAGKALPDVTAVFGSLAKSTEALTPDQIAQQLESQGLPLGPESKKLLPRYNILPSDFLPQAGSLVLMAQLEKARTEIGSTDELKRTAAQQALPELEAQLNKEKDIIRTLGGLGLRTFDPNVSAFAAGIPEGATPATRQALGIPNVRVDTAPFLNPNFLAQTVVSLRRSRESALTGLSQMGVVAPVVSRPRFRQARRFF